MGKKWGVSRESRAFVRGRSQGVAGEGQVFDVSLIDTKLFSTVFYTVAYLTDVVYCISFLVSLGYHTHLLQAYCCYCRFLYILISCIVVTVVFFTSFYFADTYTFCLKQTFKIYLFFCLRRKSRKKKWEWTMSARIAYSIYLIIDHLEICPKKQKNVILLVMF